MDASAKGAPLASPKVVKNAKGAIVPSSQMAHIAYGCEHIENLLGNARKQTVQHYRAILQKIFEQPSIIAQTSTSALDGRPVVSLRPLFLCLQCPSIMMEIDRDDHVNAKRHCFAVESREGHVYCGDCHDFIYDPDLESRRIQKGRKRKFEDSTTPDDHKLIVNNSTFLPCRAIGLRGLYNMGQTCFMSVILQTVVHNPFIRNFYLSEGHKECERESCVSCALDEMFVEFHSSEKTEGFGAVNMLMGSWLAGEALAGYNQQDAHEYMQFMLNTLHQQNGGSSNSDDCKCVIHQTFFGKLSSTVTCDNCRNTTTTQEPYMDMSLEIRNLSKKRKLEAAANGEDASTDLRACLEKYTAREKLGQSNYICQHCDSGQNAIKQLSIKQLPPVLSIHLKRFEHSKSTSSKIETKINFPMLLDLYPYTTTYRASQTKASKTSSSTTTAALQNTTHNINAPANNLVYELSAVIVHKGKMDSGHYVNYCREGNDWFLFDDSKVVLVDEAEVLGAEAYLLFYMVNNLDA